MDNESLARVLDDVAAERRAQDRLWGVQEFPDGTGPEHTAQAEAAKGDCAAAAERGELTWRHILAEEFFEALAESDPSLLRAELVQTAAVAVKWIQALDRRAPVAGEKLVRDRIPDIIRSTGREPATRVAGRSEYAALLRTKLYEEAGEYVASGNPSELADILEVLHALAALHGLTPEDLEAQRAAKAATRGAFTQRTVLTLPPPEPPAPADH
ncbi:nucleoside triphosphate pyrophosphohydrolase [Spirillospora sp. NPDC029432]|uniref:nucleoside triphosphate pyrophosphohydrolase n=1 Tax=Spirillospora sp. NPDC029432 TaxID=3154599 RepID=UPI0034569A9B